MPNPEEAAPNVGLFVFDCAPKVVDMPKDDPKAGDVAEAGLCTGAPNIVAGLTVAVLNAGAAGLAPNIEDPAAAVAPNVPLGLEPNVGAGCDAL